MELWDNVATENSKADKITQQVAGLLESKIELVLKSLSEINANAPSEPDRANQLDQLILLHLSRTLEDSKACYKENMDNHISKITIMLKVHDDMLSATDNLIKRTHVQHEKHIQRLEKEIFHKDTMNMVMQDVLIKRSFMHLNIT